MLLEDGIMLSYFSVGCAFVPVRAAGIKYLRTRWIVLYNYEKANYFPMLYFWLHV